MQGHRNAVAGEGRHDRRLIAEAPGWGAVAPKVAERNRADRDGWLPARPRAVQPLIEQRQFGADRGEQGIPGTAQFSHAVCPECYAREVKPRIEEIE